MKTTVRFKAHLLDVGGYKLSQGEEEYHSDCCGAHVRMLFEMCYCKPAASVQLRRRTNAIADNKKSTESSPSPTIAVTESGYAYNTRRKSESESRRPRTLVWTTTSDQVIRRGCQRASQADEQAEMAATIHKHIQRKDEMEARKRAQRQDHEPTATFSVPGCYSKSIRQLLALKRKESLALSNVNKRLVETLSGATEEKFKLLHILSTEKIEIESKLNWIDWMLERTQIVTASAQYTIPR